MIFEPETPAETIAADSGATRTANTIAAKDGTVTEVPEGVTFADLGLSPKLLEAVTSAGYTTPTPIQWKAIPEVIKGRDVLGIAQTGTGKTASFVLPMIEVLSQGRAKARMPRTLILEPTRELAAQVAENFEKYGKNHKLSMALLIGGVSFGDQDAALTRGVDVLIATPGRLLDHFERGKLLLTGVQMLVIDEADRMLDMGFIPDIERIAKLTPFTRQTLFFSATMPPEIQRLTNEFLSAPVQIEVARPAQAAATITQRVVTCVSGDPKTKRATLRAVVEQCFDTIKNAIIFCNRKTDVDIVAKSLTRHGFDASPIHGDLQQSQRTATLEKFRSGELKILVASDVAARGLDIPDVSHVFNYDVPRHADDYVHRIGRTGRAGRSGEAYMLVSPEDRKNLAAVEALTKTRIEVAEIAGVPTEKIIDSRSGEGRGRGERTRRPRNDRGTEGSPERPERTEALDEAGRGERGAGSRPRRTRRPVETGETGNPSPLEVIVPVEQPDIVASTGVDTPAREGRRSRHPAMRGGAREGNREGNREVGHEEGREHRQRDNRERAPRNERYPDERRPYRGERDDDGGRPVLAFGDSTPAFMLRPVVLKD
jgi:superfamily II DNA/RNA helicase